jgi:hypothetical protein
MFARAFISGAMVLIWAAATALAAPVLSCPANRLPHHPSNSIETQAQNRQALKFDEYGAVGECDATARLDSFAIQLLNEPTTTGYIIGYDGRNTLPARLGVRQQLALGYLVDSRGMNPDRLVAIKGGYREEPSTELWIAPADAPAPEPSETIIVKKETGKTFKYDQYLLYSPVVENPEDYYPQEDAASAGDTAEALRQEDAAALNPAVEQEAVPSQVVAVDDQAEAEKEDYLWASEDYARAVEAEKGDACIIYYAQREGGHLFALQQIIEAGQNLLVRKHGVQEERIKTIFGGYRDITTVKLWIIPPGASMPATAPDYERPTVDERPAGEVKEEAKNSSQ